MAYKSKYIPENLEKYKGDPTKIVFRSSWERKYGKWCDLSQKVLAWSSEEVIVPYICPTDGKKHRYFLDFYVKVQNKDGVVTENLIEIKPYKETRPPVKKGKRKDRLLMETKTFMKNQAKWAAASAYAKKRGWNFFVLTEKELYLK